MSNNNSRIFLVLLLCALLPITALVSASFYGTGTVAAVPRATALYSENFLTSTYEDSGATTAAGWGDGVVTSPKTSQPLLLDHYAIADQVTALDVQGRKVYAVVSNTSATNSLRIFDITDPANIVQRGTRTSGNLFMSVEVEGDLCFDGESEVGGSWMGVYNVSNPDYIPVPLDGYTFPDGSVTDFEVQGHFLYVIVYDCTGEDFSIWDIEDPTNIYQTTTLDYSQALGVDVEGQLAYIADGTLGLYVRNVSNPYATTHMDSVNTPGNCTHVIVDGSYAYVADGPSGVQIVNASNPSVLSIVGSCNTPGNAEELVLQGDTLFVADRIGGVRIIDVSDPTNPTNITSITGLDVYSVGLYGGVLVVGAYGGIYTYQYGSISDLSVVGSYTTYDAWDVRVLGDVAYIAAGSDGFITLDVSNPAAPVLLDQYTTGPGDFYRKLDVQGHLAFVNNYSSSGDLLTFDVSDPTDITLVNRDGGTEYLDLFAWGELLFYTYSSGYGVANISNPSNPVYYPNGIGYNVTACWVQGHHLYLALDVNGAYTVLRIFDLTGDATNPVLVGDYSGMGNHYDIYVDGDYAFAANDATDEVYNVTSPFDPDEADDIYNTATHCYGVWGFGPYMISGRYGNEVRVFDTSTVTDMKYLGRSSGVEHSLQVTVHGDYIYVANRHSLEILRFIDSRAFFATGVSTAQSLTVDNTLELITNATLTTTTTIPYGTSISYYLSADGGLHWEPVALGVPYTFTYPGSDLRLQANFTTGYPGYHDRSVYLYDVTISYTSVLPPPNLLPIIIAIIAIIIIILVILLLYFFWWRKKEK